MGCRSASAGFCERTLYELRPVEVPEEIKYKVNISFSESKSDIGTLHMWRAFRAYMLTSGPVRRRGMPILVHN